MSNLKPMTWDKDYRLLRLGEPLQKGDEAWTWLDPECQTSGWLKLDQVLLDQKIDEGHVSVRRFKGIVRLNHEENPNYAPYCGRCDGLHRMTKIAPFYWRHNCGAEHDERLPGDPT